MKYENCGDHFGDCEEELVPPLVVVVVVVVVEVGPPAGFIELLDLPILRVLLGLTILLV